MKKVIILLAAIIAVGISAYKYLPLESAQETQVRTAVEKVLSQNKTLDPNQEMPKGIELLSVQINENKVTLNFSKEIMSEGQATSEDIFSLVSNAIHPIIQG